jgi:hypothetical protein
MRSHITSRTDVEIRADPASYRRRWSLLDREGIRHLPLCENDDDAWWTPIACGGGISLPGAQSRKRVTCPECVAANAARPGADK